MLKSYRGAVYKEAELAESLILFVHGLGGDPEGTWGRFPELVAADLDLSARFDCALYTFPTSLFRARPFAKKVPPIQALAAGLETAIRVKYRSYRDVTLVCHSLGGLVARWYLYREARSEVDLRVSRLLLFAVPNDGSRIADLADRISLKHKQLRQLAEKSDFTNQLNEGWTDYALDELVEARCVVGDLDDVVTVESATLTGATIDTVAGKDHRSLVKPEDETDLAFEILREFALAPPRAGSQVGGRRGGAGAARARADVPQLVLSQLRIEDPPPWSEAGQASFELMNAGGGKAVMTGLDLVVLDCSPSQLPKLVEEAAPVPQFSYKVALSPDVGQYDVRKREFGSAPPHSYDALEVETFHVELTSTEPRRYELQFVVSWYDTTAPEQLQRLESDSCHIEFPPDVREIV